MPTYGTVNPLNVQGGSRLEFRNCLGEPVRHITIDSSAVWPPGAGTLNSKYVLPPGIMLGKDSDSGKYHPIRGTTLSAEEASGQTVLSCTRVNIFQVGDPIKVCHATTFATYGDDNEEYLGVITAIDATSKTITISDALDETYAAGAYVYVAPSTDYDRAVAVGLLFVDVDMRNAITGEPEDKAAMVQYMRRPGDNPISRSLARIHLNAFGKAEAELEAAFGVPMFCD